MKYNIGIAGLGVMGQNLALNIESRGFKVACYDLDKEKRAASQKKFEGKNMQVLPTMPEFVEVLESPKRILMMVPAGSPVDSVISDLRP
jgi:6-phosphogluconate dehydrogenase